VTPTEPVRPRNSAQIGTDCALEQEKPVRVRNEAASGVICALEQVRATGEDEVARLLDLQHGVIHREQLLAAGVGRGAVSYRLSTGWLTTVYRDVYRAGPRPLRPLALAVAAVLHFRGRAVLSGRSAGVLWELTDREAERAEVTLVGRSAHQRDGLLLHRVGSLHHADIRRRHGLPVTSPARTLVDLAATLGSLELENAYAECLQRGLARDNQIRAAQERAGRRAASPKLTALLEVNARGESPAPTRSKAERMLLELIRAAELPPPVANVRVSGHLVDLFWPQQRLIVEFDGWETHGRRGSFESDRRRDQRLVAAGYRVIRITWHQLVHESYAVIARLTAALARSTAA
jgi:very-short-patch-repair endonuclease